MRAINIKWDIDYDDDVSLPTEIEIPQNITDEEEISDYLSEVTGYCHQGFELKLECPFDGDETNDCADCVYADEYHFVEGKCVPRV